MQSQALGIRCAACNELFKARSQSPRQAYCAKPECQRERRRRWQRAKRLADPDYRYNQRDAQRAWARRNPSYWHHYRKAHPQYCERNRRNQSARHHLQVAAIFVALRSCHFSGAVPAGLYRIVRLRGHVAKMDLSDADISWTTASIGLLRSACKERTR
jgi:hypothetical protein